MREPKKVRTRPELEKSCRMLRGFNEELKQKLEQVRLEIALWEDKDQTALDAVLRIKELLSMKIEKHGTG